MTGGKAALWNDEDIADKLVERSTAFIIRNKNRPFFLLLTTHDIHVPRTPYSRFQHKSDMGTRGDVILQLDATVGRIQGRLDSWGLAQNTLVIFSSDNGPVVDDGYADSSVIKLNGHQPAGPFRGGKYSTFEGGTRVPFIVKWPQQITNAKISNALFSHIDLLASLAALANVKLAAGEAPDSFDASDVLTGKSVKDRDYLIEQADALSIIKDKWTYIESTNGNALSTGTNIESGNSSAPQLYDLSVDLKESNNLADKQPAVSARMATLLRNVKSANQTVRSSSVQ